MTIPGQELTPLPLGTWVRVKIDNPGGHSRAPLFTRGRVGQIERHLGRFPRPEFLALLTPQIVPDDLYTVGFDSTALWDTAGRCGDRVRVDLFYSYLEPL